MSTERILTTIPAGSSLEAFVVSSDGERWLCVFSRAGRFQVLSKDWKLDALEKVRSIELSPDGKRAAVSARTGGSHHIFVDGTSVAKFDQVGPVLFSANGPSFASAVRRGEMWSIAVDGKPVFPFEFDEVGDPVFAPDGTTVAFQAANYPAWRMRVGDRPGPEHDHVGPPVFSPTGCIAYPVRDGDEASIVVDGKPGPRFAEVGTPIFADDGKTVAYRAQAPNGSAHAVVGGRVGPPCEDMTSPVFRPGTTETIVAKKIGSKWTLEGADGAYDRIYQVVPSPDGSGVAFSAEEAGRMFYVVCGRRGPFFEDLGSGHFSSRGAFAYAATRGGRWHVVAEDSESPPFDRIRDLGFDSDARAVTFAACRGNAIVWQVWPLLDVGSD